MKWYVGAGLLLLVAWVLNLSLLSYSMYALVAVMLLGRQLARAWANSLVTDRQCDQLLGRRPLRNRLDTKPVAGISLQVAFWTQRGLIK